MRKKTKLVCGVGINDADYKVYKYETINGKWKVVWTCPYYKRWHSMLERCYYEKLQEKRPTYKGCTVCTEWLTFSNFKRWMEEQEWEGRQLDKDLLIEGNKVYSAAACIFLPSKLNSFTTTSGKIRGQYPLGVSYMKKLKYMVNELSKPYKSSINNQTGKIFCLGYYATPEEAHQVYLSAKLGYCEEHIEEFKDEPLILKGLIRIKDKIQCHINNNLELTSF